MCKYDIEKLIKFLTEAFAFGIMCIVFGAFYVLLFFMANP